MATCKDCFHYEACYAFSKIINAARDVEKGCEHFKNRTDVAEVVRCEKCRFSGIWEDSEKLGCGHPKGCFSIKSDSFCSYGECKTQEVQ